MTPFVREVYPWSQAINAPCTTSLPLYYCSSVQVTGVVIYCYIYRPATSYAHLTFS
jgi:hypothetical protein